MSERICAAAIKHNAEVITLAPPARHHTIMRHIAEQINWKSGDGPICGPEDQGFITDAGRFVGRREAYNIAYKADQIINGEGDAPPQLFSEDLW